MKSSLIGEGLATAAIENGFASERVFVYKAPDLALRGIVNAFSGDKEAAARAIANVLIPLEGGAGDNDPREA